MKITMLVENTTNNTNYQAQHGLSIYIETEKHKILFDTGVDDLFIRNAETLGIDLKEVDSLVISHGHYDHGGGLATFLDYNKKATIYLREGAFEPHFINVLYRKISIGLNPALADNPRIILTKTNQRIDDEIFLFADIEEKKLLSTVSRLYRKEGRKYVIDNFSHEQNLIVTEKGQSILFAGCAHRGILNIVKKAIEHKNDLKVCIGGFHLYNPPTAKYEKEDFITTLAKSLQATKLQFYTGHCTGIKAYKIMASVMAEQLKYFSTAEVLEF